jgi:hypothetical protein
MPVAALIVEAARGGCRIAVTKPISIRSAETEIESATAVVSTAAIEASTVTSGVTPAVTPAST